MRTQTFPPPTASPRYRPSPTYISAQPLSSRWALNAVASVRIYTPSNRSIEKCALYSWYCCWLWLARLLSMQALAAGCNPASGASASTFASVGPWWGCSRAGPTYASTTTCAASTAGTMVSVYVHDIVIVRATLAEGFILARLYI